MRSLSELQRECHLQGIDLDVPARPSKEFYINALRQHYWQRTNPEKSAPFDLDPMLLSDWDDCGNAVGIEQDHHAWIVQEKKDGVRALMSVDTAGVRITGRTTSTVTYRKSEFQCNLTHLTVGLQHLSGTVFDGELVCLVDELDTGHTTTSTGLQAATAILATSAKNAARLQKSDSAKIRLYVFDILRYRNVDVTGKPLSERLTLLSEAIKDISNPYLEVLPFYSVNKAEVHRTIISRGGEGTVWKKTSEPYELGKRVKHWIKLKRSEAMIGIVTGYRLGSPGRGNSHKIGAIAFSTQEAGDLRPIAWVSSWTDEERKAMTYCDSTGNITLHPSYLGRSAKITGQDMSGRSKRLRHARCSSWLS